MVKKIGVFYASQCSHLSARNFAAKN